MKKIIVSCMTLLIMIVGLVGCSPANEQESDNKQPAQSENDSSTNDKGEEQTSTPEDNNSDSNTDSTNQTDSDQNDDSESEKTPTTQQRMSRLYYYDMEKDQMFYIEEAVEVMENAYVNALTQALKDNQDNEDFVAMNSNTFVTSAKMDEENGILNIYFNESFYLSTNLGSGIEAGFIDALVNTYGYNYNVDKVAIYVENKLYEDQRGQMPNGYFPVTAETATKYE